MSQTLSGRLGYRRGHECFRSGQRRPLTSAPATKQRSRNREILAVAGRPAGKGLHRVPGQERDPGGPPAAPLFAGSSRRSLSHSSDRSLRRALRRHRNVPAVRTRDDCNAPRLRSPAPHFSRVLLRAAPRPHAGAPFVAQSCCTTTRVRQGTRFEQQNPAILRACLRAAELEPSTFCMASRSEASKTPKLRQIRARKAA